ncbi:MAG: hypothetical protein K8S00_11335 [Bacteroidales bacterium]|nr:hypothetical protein [Bacteroidales bacterium]
MTNLNVFTQPVGEMLASLRMAHDPTSANAGQCGNCQGACFCRGDNGIVDILDVL